MPFCGTNYHLGFSDFKPFLTGFSCFFSVVAGAVAGVAGADVAAGVVAFDEGAGAAGSDDSVLLVVAGALNALAKSFTSR